MKTTMICALLAGLTAAASAADRLPSGPTHKEVLVATVQDAGKPFALRTNIYLPRGAAGAPTPPLVLFIHSVVPVEQSERLYRKYLENGLDAGLYLWSRGAHGAVGLDIEAASSEWLARKLLVELAPKR